MAQLLVGSIVHVPEATVQAIAPAGGAAVGARKLVDGAGLGAIVLALFVELPLALRLSA